MPDEITRIEFEPTGDGRFRWRLWSGTHLTHDELSRPDTIDAMLETTKMLCTELPQNGDPHAQEKNRTQSETRRHR